jgi:hypothetical protein
MTPENEAARELRIVPELRIVRGRPTDEELAAVTAIVGAAGDVGDAAPAGPRPGRARGRWNDPGSGHRHYLPVGPGGWRTAR